MNQDFILNPLTITEKNATKIFLEMLRLDFCLTRFRQYTSILTNYNRIQLKKYISFYYSQNDVNKLNL